MVENYKQNTNNLHIKKHMVDVAENRVPADLVLKNATYLNVFSSELSYGDIAVANGFIVGIGKYTGNEEYDMTGKIVLPGFIDSHIHLESSLVAPKELAKALISHGTTTLVTDPHEIANVMGTDGIKYMLEATEGLPVDVHFMLPSCVPATPLDESGAELDYKAIDDFYNHPRVCGLAEFMDFVSVVSGENGAIEKLVSAEQHNKMIDGHAPMLKDKDLNAYISAGVCSDHECYDINDALTKLRLGQYIMIREGTAAQNLEALLPLLTPMYADRCMFCVDDRHPNDILNKGDIDYICKKAIKLGANPLITAKVATYNAARYFNLKHCGAIAPNYIADFAIIDSFDNFNVQMVFKNGKLCYDGEVKPFETPIIEPNLVQHAHNTFNVSNVSAKDFKDIKHNIIGMVPGEILTKNQGYAEKVDIEKDILKIAVIERHKHTNHIGSGYLQGYGLKTGAVATSISHDSHNIIVVGTNARDMAFAVNRIIEKHGGIVVVNNEQIVSEVVLEIAGIMTDAPIEEISENLEQTKAAAFKQGVNKGIDPFMTLSFMALPVIPELRMTTKGIFDVLKQTYIE